MNQTLTGLLGSAAPQVHLEVDDGIAVSADIPAALTGGLVGVDLALDASGHGLAVNSAVEALHLDLGLDAQASATDGIAVDLDVAEVELAVQIDGETGLSATLGLGDLETNLNLNPETGLELNIEGPETDAGVPVPETNTPSAPALVGIGAPTTLPAPDTGTLPAKPHRVVGASETDESAAPRSRAGTTARALGGAIANVPAESGNLTLASSETGSRPAHSLANRAARAWAGVLSAGDGTSVVSSGGSGSAQAIVASMLALICGMYFLAVSTPSGLPWRSHTLQVLVPPG